MHLQPVCIHVIATVFCAEPRTPSNQVESGLHSRSPCSLLYQIWRGFPKTPQKFSPDLQKAWVHGAGVVRRVLSASILSNSGYRWHGVQLLLTALALLFSMMPDHFFEFYRIQWLLLTVVILLVVDFALSLFLNHPNRTSQPAAIRIRGFLTFARSFFYDLFLYPVLILSIFQIIQTQSYLIFGGKGNGFDSEHTWKFATFSVIASLYITTVYIMRFGSFNSAIGSLLHNHTNTSGARKNSRFFLKGFLLQIVIQIALQVMLLIMISVRYQAERGGGNVYMRQDNDDSVYEEEGDGNTISQFLKGMIAGGLLIPILSLPMYFVSTQILVEEFNVSLFLNSPEQRALSSANRIDIQALKTEFSRFHKYNMSGVGGLLNILQPLFSPIQVILCALHTLLLLSFFLCFSLMHMENEGETVTVSAFKAGLYSDIYSMPRSVIEATFAVALLLTIFANALPTFYGIVGAVLLPFHLTCGILWLLVKIIRFRSYLSVQSV